MFTKKYKCKTSSETNCSLEYFREHVAKEHKGFLGYPGSRKCPSSNSPFYANVTSPGRRPLKLRIKAVILTTNGVCGAAWYSGINQSSDLYPNGIRQSACVCMCGVWQLLLVYSAVHFCLSFHVTAKHRKWKIARSKGESRFLEILAEKSG